MVTDKGTTPAAPPLAVVAPVSEVVPATVSPELAVSVLVKVLAPPTDWTVVKSTKFWVDEPVPPLAMERVPEERLPDASEETAPAVKLLRATVPLLATDKKLIVPALFWMSMRSEVPVAAALTVKPTMPEPVGITVFCAVVAGA